MNDRSARVPPDDQRVTLGSDHEVRYWTNRFAVSQEQLEQAIAAVGEDVDAIAAHLTERHVR